MSEANRTPTDPNSSRMVILTLAAVLAAFWGVYDQHQPVTTTAPSGQEVKRFLGEEASLNP